MEKVIKLSQVKSEKINWSTIFLVVSFHILAIWALFAFSWQNLIVASILWWISGSWGIGMGYHRLLTHRGFKAPKWLERFLTFCGTLALQGGPLSWVTTHRLHHAFTDTDKDPHSPRRGIFWAHMGWIFKGDAQAHSPEKLKRYSPDLMKDEFHVFANKYYWLTSVGTGLVLLAIGGWSMVLWGIFFRTVWGWHSTWLVNSVTHLFGTKRFETGEDSTNNAVIAALTFGEGWHNNHHAYPRSAKHGLKWYEIDVNWIQLFLLEKADLIRDVCAVDLNKTKNKAKHLRKAA